MSSVAAAVERLNALLSFVDADLPPLEPRRRDWTAVTSDLEAVEAELEGTLDALACIEDPDERAGLAADAAWGLARTGALLHNAGRPSGAALIRRAATMDRSDPALRFGGERPDGLLWLMFAIELRAAGQVARAETIVDDLRARHGSRDLDRVARNLGYINRFPVSLRTRRLRKRLAIAGGLALVALVGSIHYWSPAQRAQRAFDALVDQASTGSPADASGAWRAFLDGEHARVRADLREQALGHMLDSWIAQVPDSSALERVVTIETYTESYLALPDTWQIVPTRRQWLSALRGWAEQSDDPTTQKRLLACARRVLTDRPPDALRSDERKFGAIRGDLWREHTPLRALTAYTGAMEVPRARAQSAKLVSRIVARWGLVEAERLRLSQWRDHAEAHPDTAAARAALDAALEAVATATANPHRAVVLAGHDLNALHALVAADPADAGAVARLAELLARSGRTGDAERTISEAARPQWRTNEEERVLSTVLARTGRPQAAEDLLEAQITREVDLLISARARYEARLARVPEETWDDDAELAARRRDFRAASAVIDTALDLGAMKLARASSATTAGARARLLAEAERAFLSVGAAAKGQPRYHLELGSIYYRLGKGDDAEAAFDGVRALDDPSWTLDVAAAYRQLGMDARGRRVARDVYDTESGRARDDAARLLAHFADSSDDEAAWLERIATPRPGDRARLAEARADIAKRKPDFAAAARGYAEAYAVWASRGDDDEIALNNRALSREMQFACTGELVLLEAAVTDFAASVRMQPDDTIAVANYASALAHLAYARLLSRWMDLEQFPPPRWVSRPIVRRLARGPRRDRLTAFARSDIVESARGQLGRHHVLAPNAQQVDRDEVLFAELDSSLDPLRVLARRARHTLSADDARPDRPDDAERARAESDLRTARHWQTQATDAETSGAAYISQGIATEWVARLDADPRRFNEARRHFEAAEAAWPDLEVRHDLVRLLVAEAIAEVIAESAALKRRFIDEDWAKVPMLFAARLQDEPEARRRIIAHPQTQRALRIARTIPVGEESADLWMLGDLAGDEDLLRDHAAVFADPRAAMLVEIRARLSRFVSVQARWAFMKSRLHSAATIRD